MDYIKRLVDEYLSEHGITKNVMANMVGIGRSGFYAKLAGKVPWTLEEAINLSTLLGITVDEFARHATGK